MSRIAELEKPIGKALSLIAPGLQTFGRWPSPGRTKEEQEMVKNQMTTIAKVYAVACENDPKITPEVVEVTARRYLQGKVTIWKDGVHVPASTEFPTAPQFRDACIQTWHELYHIIAIGERIEDGAKVLITRVERREDPQPGVAALDAPASPEAVAAIKERLAKLPAALPSIGKSERRSGNNPDAENELARMREVRDKHEGVRA